MEAQRPSPAVQDYLKAIYRLSESGDDAERLITTSQVAEALGVTAASASNMLKKLDGMGLALQTKRQGVELTGRGRQAALEVIRHHRLLETYLATPPRRALGRGAQRGRGAGAPSLRGARGAHRGRARASRAGPSRRPDPDRGRAGGRGVGRVPRGPVRRGPRRGQPGQRPRSGPAALAGRAGPGARRRPGGHRAHALRGARGGARRATARSRCRRTPPARSTSSSPGDALSRPPRPAAPAGRASVPPGAPGGRGRAGRWR